MKKLLLVMLLNFLAISSAYATHIMECRVDPLTVKASEKPVRVTSGHMLSITNEKGTTQNYMVQYELYLDHQLIASQNYFVPILPRNNWYNRFWLNKNVTFNTPGKHEIMCVTMLSGVDQDRIEDHATITIT